MVDLLLGLVMAAAIVVPAVWFVRHHPVLEALALGAGAGVVLWGALALAHFFVLLPPGGPRTIGLATLAACLLAGLVLAICLRANKIRAAAARVPPTRLFLAIGAALALSLGIQGSLPHYDFANRFYDWVVHYDLARIYQTGTDLGRHWGPATVTTRTPLFNLLGAAALTIFGTRFSVFQALTAATAWLWILPFALLARRIAPRWTVPLTALAALSPLVAQAHAYTWSKGLVTFLALLALDRFLAIGDDENSEKRGIVAAQFGAVSGALVMTHPGFAGFPLGLVALLVWQVLHRRRRVPELAAAALAGVLVVLPWTAWAVTEYGWRDTFLTYPHVAYPTAAQWVFSRLVMLVTSIFPIALPLDRFTSRPLDTAVLVYLGTAAGVLGLAFLLRSLAQNLNAATRFRGGQLETPVLTFAATGVLMAAVLHDGALSNHGATFCIPGLLALLLLAVRANPLTRVAVAIAMLETSLAQAAVLILVWSPATQGGLNARVASEQHLQLLGQHTLAAGLALILAAGLMALGSLWPWLRREPEEMLQAAEVAA